ncbi:uncharacterized protein V6R79_006939 [Siganus canaliculatus]
MCETAGSHKTRFYARRHSPGFGAQQTLNQKKMLLLNAHAPWLLLLLAFLGHQVSVTSGARGKSSGGVRTGSSSPGRAQQSGSKAAANVRGKFSMGGQMQCAWTAKDAADTVRLTVKCEDPEARVRGGVTERRCHYDGKPQLCPGFRSDPRGFWKQVARAFKKLHSKTCTDERALVKAGMCKSAPRDAHFKLDIHSSVESAQSGDAEAPQPTMQPPPSATRSSSNSTECHRKKAEETCSSSWASLCAFFFSMLQNDC